MIETPFREQKETGSKHFIKKFELFANFQYRIAVKWVTRKVKSLFKVKD